MIFPWRFEEIYTVRVDVSPEDPWETMYRCLVCFWIFSEAEIQDGCPHCKLVKATDGTPCKPT